ncbi:hypothetical protein GCM10023174_06920 [Chelativorans composti]|uniref:Uncharacterized protein n=1 Tax=Chelativorans composti TaxID=768533 RepID=A0ABW5DJQ2_9HYPH
MMQALGAFMSGIDIPLMDAGNVGFGILSMLWDRGRCYYRRTQYFLVDYLAALLRGVTLFPFLILFLATLNSSLMQLLLSVNRTVLIIASVIGLVTVWNSDKWIKEKLDASLEGRCGSRPSAD